MAVKKILHTSDWHLGKKLYQESRASEHQAFLSWLLEYADHSDIDVLIFSGDLFDSPSPNHAALKMYYDFLAQWFATRPSREAFILGGNHDSGLLLDAPRSLHSQAFLDGRLHLLGSFNPNEWQQLLIKRPWGTICALPYFRLHEILNLTKIFNSSPAPEATEESTLILQTLTDLMKKWHQLAPANLPKILLGHHVFGPYSASGSELGVPLSGLETIPLSILGEWDYVALGHIHKPQIMKFQNRPVVYSGSPLRMRFSEHENKKVSIIEIDEDTQEVTQHWQEIPIFRKLYRLRAHRGNLSAKLDELRASELKKDCELPSYIEAELTCDAPWMGAADEIREYLTQHFELNNRPQLLALSYQIAGQQKSASEEARTLDFSNLNLSELFGRYYQQKYPDSSEVPSEIMNLFHQLQDSARTSTVIDETEGPHVH